MSTPSEAQTKPGNSGPGGDVSWLTGVLKAIGTGIGVVGFVAFFGAAILWLRFTALRLPANYALSLVPHAELVTTGASFLVPVAAVAVVIAGITGIPQFWRLAWAERSRKNAEKADRQATANLDAARKSYEHAQHEADELAKFVDPSPTIEAALRDKVAEAAALKATTEAATKPVLAARADVAMFKAEAAQRTLDDMLLTVMFSVASLAIAGWFAFTGGGFWMVASLLLATAVASAIAFLALSRTTRLGWSLIAVFFATGLYAVALQGLRTYHRPKIEPIALLLKAPSSGTKTQAGKPAKPPKAPKPVTGAFVTETDSQIYVAVPSVNGHWMIRTIPRASFTEERIGGLTRSRDVIALAKKLAQLK